MRGCGVAAGCPSARRRLEPGAKRYVRRLVRLQSMRQGEPVSAVAAVVWRRLVVAVEKGAAQCLLRAYPGFEAGSQMPS